MFVLIKYSNSLNFGKLWSKTRSLGQIKEIPCGHSREHMSCSIDLKIGRNVCLDKISNKFEFGSPGFKICHQVKLKNYLVGALSIDLKFGQNVCLDII